MASHAETGALPGMDLEFGPIPFSFPSTQPVHMTYEVQDYARASERASNWVYHLQWVYHGLQSSTALYCHCH